jgi:hypothetical protein
MRACQVVEFDAPPGRHGEKVVVRDAKFLVAS